MILILGGTTEGRAAAAVLEEAGTPFYYSTRGDEQEVTLHSGRRVHGALDAGGLETFVREHDIRLLVDAAHPFAAALHANAAQAAARLELPVIRYERIYPPRAVDITWCEGYEDAVHRIQKNRVIKKENKGQIKRIYPEEPENIVKSKVEQKMDVSIPIFTIGIKDKVILKDKLGCQDDIVRKHIAIQILLNIIFGESSDLYKKLYNDGNLLYSPSMDYEFSNTYAHILITGQANDIDKMYDAFLEKIRELKKNGIPKNDFERLKKMIYGEYIKEFDEVSDIARMFLVEYFKGIQSFMYLEDIDSVTLDYARQIFTEIFDENKIVLSVVKS